MKKIKLIILGLSVSALAFSSCSDDFLDTYPTNAESASTMFETDAKCYAAIQGVHKLMISQLRGTQSESGVGTMLLYADFLGEDLASVPGNGWFGAPSRWTEMQNENGAVRSYPYFFYYMIIGNVNDLLYNLDQDNSNVIGKKHIKAQSLAYRAWCYLGLAQIYGTRWIDNPDAYCVPIVTKPTPLDYMGYTRSKTRDVIAQANKDIDEAIKIFTETPYTRTSSGDNEAKSNLNINVAKGIKARIALFTGDWATAAANAQAARSGFALMSNDQYLNDGFNDITNSEWIWGARNTSAQTLYFFSYFAYMGANSSASAVMGSPRTINMLLYNKIPDTDVRRSLFLYLPDQPVNKLTAQAPAAELQRQDLVYGNTAATGTAAALTAAQIAAYRAQMNCTKNNAGSTSVIWNYMQKKYWGVAVPGVGDVCLMRSAEMYYIEAEALANIAGKDAEAAQALFNVVSPRDPAYVMSTKTGNDLKEEIYTYKRFDLWGEGHRFFDLKRRKQEMSRKSFAEGGNSLSAQAITIKVDDERWTFGMPKAEIDFNKNLDSYTNPVLEK